MKDTNETRFVVPIPAMYHPNQELNFSDISKYLLFLESKKVGTVMTTAGTSQFNLLSNEEIVDFNNEVFDSSERFDRVILGLPPVNTLEAASMAMRLGKNDRTYVMALYPDRYYSDDCVVDYFKRIRDVTINPIYVHDMPMRKGKGGEYQYTSDILCKLFEEDVIIGIKEEHKDLNEAFSFVRELPSSLDVIVAGGSMRRHQFLKTAGANAFLSGVGNIFPEIERAYCEGKEDRQFFLDVESSFFEISERYGWHPFLRMALRSIGFCDFYRMPWPKPTLEASADICLKIESMKQDVSLWKKCGF